MVYTYLITGANKGIGLGLVEELAERHGVRVIATARSPAKATELRKLAESTKKVEIIELDVSSNTSIDRLGTNLDSIAPEGIDFLISNAGTVGPVKRSLDISKEEYQKVLDVNLFGSLFVFKLVYPFLLKKDTRKVAFTSSAIGSITLFTPIPQAPYGISKVALNYLTKSLSLDHQSENFTFVSIHPGLVKTDLSSSVLQRLNAEQLDFFGGSGIELLSPRESAIFLVKIYDSITTEDSGKFYNYDGTEHPL